MVAVLLWLLIQTTHEAMILSSFVVLLGSSS
jgi:hypothetical protein